MKDLSHPLLYSALLILFLLIYNELGKDELVQSEPQVICLRERIMTMKDDPSQTVTRMERVSCDNWRERYEPDCFR